MKQFSLLKFLPDRLRMSVGARYFARRRAQFPELYEAAQLKYARGVTMELVAGDAISDSIALSGVYELPLTRRLIDLAKKGGTLIDIGANLGYFSLLWVAQNPNNTCLAFEAAPRNIEMFRRNVDRNQFHERITFFPLAVGLRGGKMLFEVGPEEQTGWGGFAPQGSTGGIAVDVVRVDEVLPRSTTAALMKIDVEGADTWALLGCEKLLRQHAIREIWYEQHKPRMKALGISPDLAQEYLQSLRYEPWAHERAGCDVVQWSAVRRRA